MLNCSHLTGASLHLMSKSISWKKASLSSRRCQSGIVWSNGKHGFRCYLYSTSPHNICFVHVCQGHCWISRLLHRPPLLSFDVVGFYQGLADNPTLYLLDLHSDYSLDWHSFFINSELLTNIVFVICMALELIEDVFGKKWKRLRARA